MIRLYIKFISILEFENFGSYVKCEHIQWTAR